MASEALAGPSARRRQLRRYAMYGAAAALAGTLAYKAYSSNSVAQTRHSLARLRAALVKYSEALSSSADLCCTLVRDLQRFLQSDSTEVPGSLRQLAKLLQSQEVTQTTTKAVAAVYRGVAGESNSSSGGGSGEGALDKVLTALLSDRGHSLVSVAVSMGARNMVGALLEANARVAVQQQRGTGGQQPAPGMVDKILDFMATERGQRLTVAAITAFVSNGVRQYMDATLDINFYEDIFSSMSRPAHLEAVKQCIGMFAREAVGTAMQGSPPRQQPQRSSPRSDAQRHEQQQQQCPDLSRGSPLDSAFRSESPAGGSVALDDDEATSARPRQQGGENMGGHVPGWAAAASTSAAAADDLDSDSLLYARREVGAKQAAPPAQQQQEAGPTWPSLVTKEVLTMVKDPNARTLVVGAIGAAAGASARELGAAAVAGLAQMEVTRRWGMRGLVALLLLTFLAALLIQELLRTAVLAILR